MEERERAGGIERDKYREYRRGVRLGGRGPETERGGAEGGDVFLR